MHKLNGKVERIYSRGFRFPRASIYKVKSNEKKHSDGSGNNGNKIFKIVCILLVEIFATRAIINAINPVINVQSVAQARNIATIICNEQANLVMEKYKYEDLAVVVKDDDGKIQMIKLNIVPVNEIISDVAINIQKDLNNTDSTSLNLRLGSFTGIKLLSGVGPKVKIRVSSVGNIETNLKSIFTDAGINQTLHKIYLDVGCEVVILTPFDVVTERIQNQILIAESLIMGEIPSSYYNFNEAR